VDGHSCQFKTAEITDDGILVTKYLEDDHLVQLVCESRMHFCIDTLIHSVRLLNIRVSKYFIFSHHNSTGE